MRDRIIELRNKLGLNQTKFAESIGVSRNFINLYEHGNRELSDRTIYDICRVHHVNEIWLRTGEGDPYVLSDVDKAVLQAREVLKDDDPIYKEEFISILKEIPPSMYKVWYGYAKQWIENVEQNKKPPI